MNIGNTNRAVISTVRHSLEVGAFTDDSTMSNRELYFLLLRYRAAILAQKLRDRASTLSRYNQQTISCVSIEDVATADCPCFPESGKVFKRTKFPIPKPIGNFTSVISPGNDITYTYISWEAIQDLKVSRFKAERDKAYYTLKNSGIEGTYIYLYNEKHGESISIAGVFENPLEIQNFWDCEGKQDPCFSPLDQEFIIDPELLPVVYDMLLNSKNKYRPRVNDIHNNNLDETQEIRPPVK